jgi:hypothetical protein
MARSHVVLGQAVMAAREDPGLWVRWIRTMVTTYAVEHRQDLYLQGLPDDDKARREALDELLGGPGACDLRDALVVALEAMLVGTPIDLVRARLREVLSA